MCCLISFNLENLQLMSVLTGRACCNRIANKASSDIKDALPGWWTFKIGLESVYSGNTGLFVLRSENGQCLMNRSKSASGTVFLFLASN